MANPQLKPVTHCIFDMDGLLLDTEKIYFETVDAILQEFGQRYSHEVANRLRGSTRSCASQLAVKLYNLPITPEELLQRLDKVLPQKFADCDLMPGAEKLIRHLHKHNIPIAVGTSSCMDHVNVKFSQHQDLRKLFNHIVSGSDDPEVKESKPAPDVFLVCARRFVPPLESADDCAKALVFEDAPSGVRAALAAGMQVVMVPDPRAVTDEQKREATLCIESLENFKPELFGLPPFDS